MQWLYLLAVAALLTDGYSTFLHARAMPSEDRWNPAHISELPAEIQEAVTRLCGHRPLAEHYFATYFQNARVIKLHYEHFRCDGRALLCHQSGCLHQEYVSTGGHYRLLRSFYAPGND